MFRYDIINFLIKKNNYKKYLEIGVFRRTLNFDKIKIEYKKCVDPMPEAAADFIATSNNFFEKNEEMFDIIFIDGLHLQEQVFKDITNSLESLSLNGVIVCHDLLPVNETEQEVPIKTKVWTGDCWKTWFKCLSLFDDLEMWIVNTDHGVGIIKKGKQNKINIDKKLDWEFFLENKQLMNIISVKQFIQMFE